MFKDLFATIFGISYETRILEACSWDEERAEHVCEILSYELMEAAKNSSGKTEEEILEDLRESLFESVEEHESEVLISVISDAMQNKEFLMQEVQEFEN